MMPTVRPLGNETWQVLEAPVLALQAVRGYILTEHRNAWHSTVSSKYRGPVALHVTPGDAQLMAERWRKRGTYFRIYEVPSLRFVTDAGSLVVTDFHSTEPFEGCRHWFEGSEALSPGKVLMEALSPIWMIEHGTFGLPWGDPMPSKDSIVMGVIAPEDETRPVGRAQLVSWKSYVESNYPELEWRSSPNDYSAASVHRLVRRFRENGRKHSETP